MRLVQGRKRLATVVTTLKSRSSQQPNSVPPTLVGTAAMSPSVDTDTMPRNEIEIASPLTTRNFDIQVQT